MLLAAANAPALPLQDGAEAARECEAATQASDWDTAVTRCAAAIEALPDTYGIYYFLGLAHQQRQEWTEAAAAFESFVSASEAEPEGQAQLAEQIRIAVRGAALARIRAGDRAGGLPLLRHAAEADPADAEVAFFLGVALLEEGDRQGAEAAFLVVSAEAPQISEAHFFLGQLHYEAGDYEAARTHLDGYLDAAPGGSLRADAHWMAGSMALRNTESGTADPEGAENDALRHFGAFLEVEPETARAAVAHYFVGTIAADREECDAARRHYRDFLRIAPEHERASDVQRYLEEGFGSCEAPPGEKTLAESEEQAGSSPTLCQQPVAKLTRPSSPGGGSAGDASRLEQPVAKPPRRSTGDPSRLNRAALRRSSLRFGRNTLGIPPSRALSAGRLTRLGAHASSTPGC